jgi:diaminopimelate epimerase
MKFTKMHGTGNDYVYINYFEEHPVEDPQALARAVTHRHFGIGADGLVLIKPGPDGADAEMVMYNVDGTLAEMCGNALRCVAKFLYDKDIARKEQLRIMTGAGLLSADILKVQAGKAEEIRLDMGAPVLSGPDIPTTFEDDPVVNHAIDIEGRTFEVTCVSMGNPHCVIYVDQVADYPVEKWGPVIETSRYFPNRVNVEFVQILSTNEVIQRTWERGCGETWACGTGASAVAVAGVLAERTDRALTIHLKGGDLKLHYTEPGPVLLTGPAVEVFEGTF